jgi:hypothetical protein
MASTPPEVAGRLRYILGEGQPRTPAHLNAWQLALIGSALRNEPECAINSVPVPWTFTFNGSSDHATLAGCPGTCCPDVRDIWHISVLAGIRAKTRFLVMTGDAKPPMWWPQSLPVICGNRIIGGPGIVLPTSSERWFGAVTISPRNKIVIPWRLKHPRLFWRGDASGFEPGMSLQRAMFVHELRARGHNVSFTRFPSELRRRISYLSRQLNRTIVTRDDVAPAVPIEEHDRYQFLLCLEGNSMASSVLWMLASESVVLMPPPTQEGWAGEGLLQPWVHYVPLHRPSDVDTALAWLRAHPAATQMIIRRANAFVHRLRHEHRCSPPDRSNREAVESSRESSAWTWSEARDGPRDEAEERRRIIECLMRPRQARAILERASEAWRTFSEASALSTRALMFRQEFEREMEQQSLWLATRSTPQQKNDT